MHRNVQTITVYSNKTSYETEATIEGKKSL